MGKTQREAISFFFFLLIPLILNIKTRCSVPNGVGNDILFSDQEAFYIFVQESFVDKCSESRWKIIASAKFYVRKIKRSQLN